MTSASISGLADGTGYTFKVAATNSVGTSALSTDSNQVVPQAATVVPTIVPTVVPSVTPPAVKPPTVTAIACVVPKLRNVKLAAARKRIAAGHCRTGKITRKKAAKAKRGRVLEQSPRAGRRLAANTKVKLTVGR